MTTKTAPAIKPINQIAGGHIFIAGKSAQRKTIPQATAIVLARDAGREIQYILKTRERQILKGRFFDNLNCLRQLGTGNIAAISLVLMSNQHLLDYLTAPAFLPIYRKRKATPRQNKC